MPLIPGIVLGLWLIKKINQNLPVEEKVDPEDFLKAAPKPEEIIEQVQNPGISRNFELAQKNVWVTCPQGVCEVFYSEAEDGVFCNTCQAEIYKVLEDRAAREELTLEQIFQYHQEAQGPDSEVFVVSIGNQEFSLVPETDLRLWRELYELSLRLGEFNGTALEEEDEDGISGYRNLLNCYWTMLGIDQFSREEYEFHWGMSPMEYDLYFVKEKGK